jgi:mRNA interferase RelE/StbE
VIVQFDRSFVKFLSKINDQRVFQQTEKLILLMEGAKSPLDIPHTQKLSGFKNYYRTRMGEFRLGFEKTDSHTIRLIIIAHRKDIYKYFP